MISPSRRGRGHGSRSGGGTRDPAATGSMPRNGHAQETCRAHGGCSPHPDHHTRPHPLLHRMPNPGGGETGHGASSLGHLGPSAAWMDQRWISDGSAMGSDQPGFPWTTRGHHLGASDHGLGSWTRIMDSIAVSLRLSKAWASSGVRTLGDLPSSGAAGRYDGALAQRIRVRLGRDCELSTARASRRSIRAANRRPPPTHPIGASCTCRWHVHHRRTRHGTPRPRSGAALSDVTVELAHTGRVGPGSRRRSHGLRPVDSERCSGLRSSSADGLARTSESASLGPDSDGALRCEPCGGPGSEAEARIRVGTRPCTDARLCVHWHGPSTG
jgi:hypothetical protein